MEHDGHSSQSLAASLAALDWPRVHDELLRFASYVTRSRARSPEIVNDALARALDPNDEPWRPELEPRFARHVMRIIDNLHRAAKDTARARRDPRNIEAVRERTTSHPATPEQDALAAERDARAERLLAALRERLAGDPLALQIVDLASDGHHDRPADQALATGRSIEEIRNARKRVKRVVDALVAEDQIDTETLEKQAAS